MPGMCCHSFYARENNSRFHDDLDHDRSDQQSRLICRPNCCHASYRTSKDRLASISLRCDRLGRCRRNWPNSTRRHGNSSSLIAGRRRSHTVRFGLQMVFGWIEQTGASVDKGRDLAVFPLAVPAIAGPGAITAVILLTDNDVYSVHERAETAVVLLIVLALNYVLLLLSDVILRIIGRQGAAILTRVMGIILTALSVEFVLAGLQIGSWATPHR